MPKSKTTHRTNSKIAKDVKRVISRIPGRPFRERVTEADLKEYQMPNPRRLRVTKSKCRWMLSAAINAELDILEWLNPEMVEFFEKVKTLATKNIRALIPLAQSPDERRCLLLKYLSYPLSPSITDNDREDYLEVYSSALIRDEYMKAYLEINNDGASTKELSTRKNDLEEEYMTGYGSTKNYIAHLSGNRPLFPLLNIETDFQLFVYWLNLVDGRQTWPAKWYLDDVELVWELRMRPLIMTRYGFENGVQCQAFPFCKMEHKDKRLIPVWNCYPIGLVQELSIICKTCKKPVCWRCQDDVQPDQCWNCVTLGNQKITEFFKPVTN